MGRLKEYLNYLKFIFLDNDNIETEITTDKRIETINSCGNILSEYEKDMLAYSLRDLDKIENAYDVNFSAMTMTKINIDEERAIRSSKNKKNKEKLTQEKNKEI